MAFRLSFAGPFARSLAAAAAVQAIAAIAGAQAPLSLSSAVDLALRSNPRVLSAKADADHARASLSEAKDAFVPVISVTGGVGKSTGVPLGGPPEIFTTSAQSLVFNYSQRDYIRAARSGWDASRLAVEQAEDDAAEDVVTTYLQLDNASARRAAAQEELDHAHRLLQIVNDRVAAGTDAHAEIPRADLTVVQIEQQLAHLDGEIAELADHLARLTGLPGMSPATEHASIPPLPDVATLTRGTVLASTNPAVEAAFATARSRLDIARGDARYLYRPQVAMGAQYARITTDFTQYSVYYPGFDPARHPGISYNSFSVGLTITLPVLDQAHRAKARESAADARKADADARNAQNLFLEGRLKLERATTDLDFSARIAQDKAAIAQDELDAVLIQLQNTAPAPNTVPLSPKDEQNARLALAQRRFDLLSAQLQLQQTEISLLRQNGQLHNWLRNSLPPAAPAAPAPTPQ